MRILVTGGAGYIGSVAVETLHKSGYEISVLDDCSTGHADTVPEFVEFIEGSILDRDAIRHSLIGCDAVLHFAGLASVAESINHPDKYWMVNVDGSRNLLNEMRMASVKKIVFSSSAAVYGEITQMPIPESTTLNPTNPYGASKKAVEQLIAAECSNSHLAGISLRYFNVAGALKRGDAWLHERHDPETHLIPRVFGASTDEPFEIFGGDWDTHDGTCIRDFVHVVDLCEAHLLALDLLTTGKHEAINLGSGKGYSVNEVLEEASSLTGRTLPTVIRPRRTGDPALLVADIGKARSYLRWAPRNGLRQMIEDSAKAIQQE